MSDRYGPISSQLYDAAQSNAEFVDIDLVPFIYLYRLGMYDISKKVDKFTRSILMLLVAEVLLEDGL